MKKGILFALLALCLPLCGCTALLERSYSRVEPYADRYWDPAAEDTLRAENYQDLVNSLLMLVEQRAEEGAIRCYEEAHSYQMAQMACQEVRQETTLGAYLLEELTFAYENSAGYCTLSCYLTYRQDAEDPASIMTLSDSQSLVDLLRLAIREELPKLTAQFVYDTPREEITAVVERFWRELCQESKPPEDIAEDGADDADSAEDGADGEGGEAGDEDREDKVSEEPEKLLGEAGGALPVSAPCPRTVRFYPDQTAAGIVEILLNQPPSGEAPSPSVE